ncbi:hypothetical protein WJX73_004911 [Symbiochloris irregularis]|uniref:C2H2-type domain-containing protein n=1 Tax=Symbiochloris irregularis TaxID=706552 RepID=A0AAW1PBU3_9CHLO
MKGGGVGKRKVGGRKRKPSHKQGDRKEFERRHIDQIWEDVRKASEQVINHKAGTGPVGTSSQMPLDDELPAHGQHYCTPCSRYFVNEFALLTHDASKPHKRRVKLLQDTDNPPHTQRAADAAAGMGAPDNGALLSMHVLGGVADIAL